MSNSDKHCCKLCGNKTYEIFAYPHAVPEVFPFKAYKKRTVIEGEWLDVELRICPKCGHVQGEILTKENND